MNCSEQASDAGRRVLVIPAADTKKAVLETFGEVLDFPEHYGVNLDALNDSLHDFADTVTDDGKEPLTFIWQVPAVFRSDRSFGDHLRDPPGRRELRRQEPVRHRRLPLADALALPAAKISTLSHFSREAPTSAPFAVKRNAPSLSRGSVAGWDR